MLTKLIIKNFKRFEDVGIELGNPVVFIGPNNSGKTTALQALALWDVGLRRWREKRGDHPPEERSGVTINRRDLIAVPVPDANLLWRDLRVRDVRRVDGKQRTSNVRIEIIVEGVTGDNVWFCGLEFDYANDESLYCRPLRMPEEKRMPVPTEAMAMRVAFLPPMSGLASSETRLDIGAVNVRIGEGRTAEVLRNLCYQIVSAQDGEARWKKLCERITTLFGVRLDAPNYLIERGEVTMTYRDRGDIRLDLASTGRGLQQTLLLLAYLEVNPQSVLLLDEPDAHLEVLRQRQIYQVLSETARSQQSQIIVASHSEIILNEAADRDVVVAFVGQPHRINDRGSQVRKALKEIGFDEYYQAEQTGWVLYLEGSTDLAILQAFAQILNHPASAVLTRPFVMYIANQPAKAREHFHGLREARKDLVGFALFDQIKPDLGDQQLPLSMYKWQRNEIENYLAMPQTLFAYAAALAETNAQGPIFVAAERERYQSAMRESIEDFVPRAALRDINDAYWRTVKASDDLLDRVFDAFFLKLGMPNLLRKSAYHQLAIHVAPADIDPEIIMVLDLIVGIAQRARAIE